MHRSGSSAHEGPHKGLVVSKKADLAHEVFTRSKVVRKIWLGLDCFNIFGLNNVSSYYWVTNISYQQYAVPNYLTGRMLNGRILIDF